jgi:hypothetical protein
LSIPGLAILLPHNVAATDDRTPYGVEREHGREKSEEKSRMLLLPAHLPLPRKAGY